MTVFVILITVILNEVKDLVIKMLRRLSMTVFVISITVILNEVKDLSIIARCFVSSA